MRSQSHWGSATVIDQLCSEERPLKTICSIGKYCCLKQPLTLYKANFHYFVPRKDETQKLPVCKRGLYFIFSRPYLATLTVLGPRLDSIQYLGLSSTLESSSEIILPRFA